METIKVHTSPTEVILPLLLLGAGVAWLTATVDYLVGLERLFVFGLFATLFVVAGSARLIGRGPRLVITPENLGWRSGQRGPLQQVAWSEIQEARIEPGLRRTPPRLRLILASSSVLETIASGDPHRYVDIPIDGINPSWSGLRTSIHRAAPHLFPPSA